MYFPALVTGPRRLGRWLVYELFQLALWAALVLRTVARVRSAFRGSASGVKRSPGKAIRPRRAGAALRGNDLGPSTAA